MHTGYRSTYILQSKLTLHTHTEANIHAHTYRETSPMSVHDCAII